MPRNSILLSLAMAFTVLALVLLSAVPCGAQERSFTTMRIALASAHAADAVTTWHALSTGKGTEANPLMRPVAGHPATLTVAKAGGFLVTDYLLRKLAKRHSRAALVTGWIAAGVLSSVAISNARIQWRQK